MRLVMGEKGNDYFVAQRRVVNGLRERCQSLSLSIIDTQEILDNQRSIDYFHFIDTPYRNGEKQRSPSFDE